MPFPLEAAACVRSPLPSHALNGRVPAHRWCPGALAVVVCWGMAGPAWAQLQGAAAPSDKATMERAQREADGPRRRILEAAAKAKVVVVRATEPVSIGANNAANNPATNPANGGANGSAANAVLSNASAAAAVAGASPAAAETAPSRPLAVLQGALAPVAVPSAEQVAVATSAVVPVRLAPVATAALSALPSAVDLAPPRLLNKVDPEFSPRLMRRLSRRVEMRVELAIEADGRVREAQVAKGVNEELATAVREAMLQWRYEPQAAARRHNVDLIIDPS